MDIRVLCPPRARPPHGHAAPGTGSSGFSASLVSRLQSRRTPSVPNPDWCVPPIPTVTGPWDPGLAVDRSWSLTRLFRGWNCRGNSAPFSGRREFLSKQERGPPHPSWASCSEPPAQMHNTNATADLSACNGTSATLGQHNACPDRDDTERTRPVTTPSVPLSHDLRPLFAPLEFAYATYDASTHISDDLVLFWHPPSAFSQWTPSPFTVDFVEYNCPEQFIMASKARLFGDDTALSAILASDDPREQKRLGRQVRHFDHDLWQTECENIVLHGNLAKFSQNEEMRLALTRTGDRRLAEASPNDNLWGVGLSTCDPRASFPYFWCGQTLVGQALEHVREILRRDTTAPLCNPAPEVPVPRDDTGDTVFEVDTVTHLRLDMDPPSANTQTVTLSAFTDSVPDDHAPEVLFAQERRIDAPLIPEQGPDDLIGAVVTMDDATFPTLLSFHSGVSTTPRFNCRAQLDTGSPQSFIHQEAFD